MRDFLRGLPVFATDPPQFDPAAATPDAHFLTWLRHAVDAGEPEPHAMTLSTVDAAGVPDARVLILKDVDAVGWWFAGSRDSAKGVQLAGRPAAALTFHWPGVGRQVRVRGAVVEGTSEQADEDFRARGESARAVALAGTAAGDPTESDAAITAAMARLDEDPALVAPGWRVWAVQAASVEFWQADPGRRHLRLRYERLGEGPWESRRLRP